MKLTTTDFGPQAGALEAFLDQVDEAPAERWLVVHPDDEPLSDES